VRLATSRASDGSAAVAATLKRRASADLKVASTALAHTSCDRVRARKSLWKCSAVAPLLTACAAASPEESASEVPSPVNEGMTHS